jgi:tRNA G18 (ribose-2'-O)-methylase SpoU
VTVNDKLGRRGACSYVASMTLPARPGRHEFPTLPRRPIRVVLDGVSCLPNIGTMFRLCDAFRVERLYVCGFTLQTYKRNLRTAATGTIAWVPHESGGDAASIVRESRAAGYSIAAVELLAASVPPEGVQCTRPICLVVGAENRGVSPELLALADQHVAIPTDGIGGSINLTTAAAIVLYELSRR